MMTPSALLRVLVSQTGPALLLTASLFAQQQNPQASSAPQSPEQFKLKMDVNRVVVDVVVTDSNGKPVPGLTRQDFFIREDRTPQSILSFDLHALDSNPSYSAKLPPQPPNTFVNIATEPERGPLYVLLLDLVNIEQSDQPYARQQLLKFVDSKPQGTRFAVFVLSDGMHLVQGFTADRAQLYATLNPSHSIPHVPRIFLMGANYGRNDPVAMVSVFKQIALYLDGLAGRKNIIWVSGNFPLDLFPHDDDHPDTREEVRETLDALARSESAVYPVSVTGVEVFPSGRSTGSTTTAAGSSGPPGAPASNGPTSGPLASEMSVAGTGSSLSENNAVQDVIARMTGGRAFYSRNDLKDMLEEATEAGSSYYTLTYSPSNQTYDGKLRSIEVALTNKSYHLEYRRAYLATTSPSPILPARYQARKQEETANMRPIGDSLAAYMQHGAPIAREVYFRSHIRPLDAPHLATAAQMANLVEQPTYFHERQRKHPKKSLSPIRLQTYLIEYQIIARIPNLEVAAGLYDEDGQLLNGDVEEASSSNPAAADPKAKFTYFRVQQKVDVPAGSASLRLGVRDKSTDRMGTMEISLPLASESSQTALSQTSGSESHNQQKQ